MGVASRYSPLRIARLPCGMRGGKQTSSSGNCSERHEMRDAQSERDPFVHANELDDESRRAGAHEIAAEYACIANTGAPPSKQEPAEQPQADGFVELGWMDTNCGRRKSLGK